MVNKKINDLEIGAILEAFASGREDKAVSIYQSKTFKALIVFCNIYVLSFSVVYFFLKSNLLDAFDDRLLTEDFSAVFDARANILFWLCISMNMGAYFNFGFKLMSLISLVYVLNVTIENAVIFSGLISLDDRPYFSVFILSRPLFIVALVWMGLAYKDKLEDY